MTPFAIGVALALATAVFARVSGFDRDRAFYPTVLIVVACYYILFAAMAPSGSPWPIESVIACAFLATAAIGFRSSLWIVAAGLVAHGVLDLTHARLVDNPGVPPWWPAFCMAYDVALGAVMALLLAKSSR
jgi:hypothetical protein